MSDIYATNLRTLSRGICIIAGASKGLGRALAHEVGDQPFEKTKHVKKNIYICNKYIVNELINKYLVPGVPLVGTWLCPHVGGSLWEFVAETEGRAAQLH